MFPGGTPRMRTNGCREAAWGDRIRNLPARKRIGDQMNGSRNGFGAVMGSGNARRRGPRLAPVTRAIRVALAASALAMAGSGTALAADGCLDQAPGAIRCLPAAFSASVPEAVEDLTVVMAAADVDIDNSDPISKIGLGDQIGIYADATGGDATVSNSADIDVYALGGIGDGIFATGNNVDVQNSGDIYAVGTYWGAGIEAQGEDLTTVTNTGSIYAGGYYGFGIYATGDQVEVSNEGDIEAQGFFAHGIYTQSGGDTTISNSGDITAGTLFEYNGYLYGSYAATGIHAGSNYAGAATTVTNSGDIGATGFAGATGIEVLATGEGGTGSVVNSGNLYASQYSKYGFGAAGIVVSADGDADIDNSGAITAISGGSAYGLVALSFNGDANVTNSGDIDVHSTGAAKYYGAYGILAASQNGSAHVDNSGAITVASDYLGIGYVGAGIRASGLEGATVTNSGDISVDAKYAYGIYATSGAGDVSVSNSGLVDVYSYFSVGFGALALSTQGDIEVVNDGTIDVYAYGQAVGLFARSSEGDVHVDNNGDISVESGGGTAAGIFARSDYGAMAVHNDGSIYAYAGYGQAFGILGAGDSVEVTNGGDIDATGYAFASGINVYGFTSASVVNDGSIGAYGVNAANGIYAGGAESAGIVNNGEVVAVSYGLATGLYGYSPTGDVDIENNGYVGALSLYGVADGIFASGGDVHVDNNGDIVAIGSTWGAGIEAQGSVNTAVHNAGSIYAYGYYGFGIYATGDGIEVGNDGSIEAQGFIASGIYAQGTGDIDITSSGDIVAGTLFEYNGYLYGSLLATGIHASSNYAGSSVGIANSGDIAATAYQGAVGIEALATGEGGVVGVSNSGNIYASQYSKYGYGAAGIVASGDGNASIDNSGLLAVDSGGLAYGAVALSFNGDASVVNSGDIDVHSTGAAKYYGAYGIVAASLNGSASVDNSGSINVVSDYLDIGYIGMGIQAVGLDGATVTNSGDISVDAKYAYGIYASSGAGDVAVTNEAGGLIDVYSYFSTGFGILALSTAGDIEVENAGAIDVYAYGQAVGAFTSTSAGGSAHVHNSGDIAVESGGGVAAGAFARASVGEAVIENAGSIAVDAPYGVAYGALVRGVYGSVVNAGDIDASGLYAFGAYADGLYEALVQTDAGSSIVVDGIYQGVGAMATSYFGEAVVDNAGSISASSDQGAAFGVYAYGYGDVYVANSGDIHATSPVVAIGVRMVSYGGTSTLVNSGTIVADGPDGGAAAVMGSAAEDRIYNSGEIHGAIVTSAGDDLVANLAGGTWHAHDFTSSLGDGDDTIDNAGTIHIENGGIFMGAGDNAFANSGVVQVSGYGIVSLGTAGSRFDNDGAISLVDGGANDLFVLAGDLGGSGSINVDFNQASAAADLAYIYGNVVDGSSQSINLWVEGVPTQLQSESVTVVEVSGDVAANAFTGGTVLNFDASNFLDLDVNVTMAQAGGLNLVNASVEVAGLNDTGILAAAVAPGVHRLIGSSVGTLRQRMGVAPQSGEGRVGLGPWLRYYVEDGDVSPSGSGFSAGSDFGFDQENRGREVGLNLPIGAGFSIGVLAGHADATQTLTGASGSDRIDLGYSGLYGNWMRDDYYFDVSMRWMDFEAELFSAAGGQRTSGNATAFNVEAGYSGWSLGAFSLTPQVQYTRAKIDDIAPIQGSEVAFAADGGISERLRVGLGLSRSFTTGNGAIWTPYGAVSMVREEDGESRYMVDGNALFSGATSIDGTSALVEAGVGAQFGGFTFTGGLNWADGGALDSNTGGQLVVRYSW